jgi:hypothetical protein
LTVRRVLKKNRLKPWLRQRWCIPPEQSGAFVWRMEDILEVYTQPYDPQRPQVCMDEASEQLLADPQSSRPPDRRPYRDLPTSCESSSKGASSVGGPCGDDPQTGLVHPRLVLLGIGVRVSPRG